MWAKYVGESIFFFVALPLFAYQTFEILHAVIDFLADFTENMK